MFNNRNLGDYPLNNNNQAMDAVPIRQRIEGADGSPMAQRRRVKVYFIGHRMLHSKGVDPESKYRIDPDTGKRIEVPQEEWKMLPATEPPLITVRGRALKMPPLGEGFEVDELMAENLQRRLRSWHPRTNEMYEGLTRSPEIARAVKEAYERGDIENLNTSGMQKAAKLVELSDDDLAAELERRTAARLAAVTGGAEPGSDELVGNPNKRKRNERADDDPEKQETA